MSWWSDDHGVLTPQALILLNHGQVYRTTEQIVQQNNILGPQNLLSQYLLMQAFRTMKNKNATACFFAMSSHRYPRPCGASRQTLWGRSKQAIVCQQLNKFRGKEKVYVNLDAPWVIKVGRKSYLMISILIAAIQHVFCSFWSLDHHTKIY